MLFLYLYQVFVLLFPWMISWNSVASSQKLWKRQVPNLCPNKKWKEFNGMCFLEVKHPAAHSTARDRCKNKFVGSYLVKIRSRDDLNFIVDSFDFKKPYWIGLGQNRGDRWRGKMYWQDGSNGTFLNFFRGEPTNYAGEECVEIHPGGGYYDDRCEVKHWAICSIHARPDFCKTENVRCHENAQCYSTFLTYVCLCNEGSAGDGISSCNKSNGCPCADWKEHKGLCYIENSQKLTYPGARSSCRSKYKGSSLAKFRYEGDQEFFVNSFNFSGYYWIGLKTKSITGLKWDDESIVNYISFSITEPNNYDGKEECHFIDGKGEVYDASCSRLCGSFCSINALQSEVVITTKPVKTTIVITTTVETTTVETTTVETIAVETTTVETTSASETVPVFGKRAVVSSVEYGSISGVVGCLLVLVAFFGYKKFRSQRSNPQSGALQSKDAYYQKSNEISAEEKSQSVLSQSKDDDLTRMLQKINGK